MSDVSDASTEQLVQAIPLTEMIQSLRDELAAAVAQGRDQSLRFEVGSAELEFEVVATRSLAAGASIKFWVVTASGKAAFENEVKHRFKLSLLPKMASGGAVNVSR